MRVTIAMLAVFCDQVAMDSGNSQLAWLMAGLPEPAVLGTAPRRRDQPYSPLADPRWLAANIAYLRDLEYLSARVRSGNAGQQGSTHATQEETSGPRPPAKAKQRGKGGGAGAGDAGAP